MEYTFIAKPGQLTDLAQKWEKMGITCVAMDFEEESNLHCYGEHVCIIQIYDRHHYYIIDVLALKDDPIGHEELKAFLEGPVEKIMFACQSDASLARKALGIQLANIYDVRVVAIALEFMGNLTGLIERNLGIQSENPSLKKKYQTANWMHRPIAKEQIEYALGDVQYLFDLKQSLEDEMKQKLPIGKQKQIAYEMRSCALQKNPEKPGWEKICNFKLLNAKEKVYIKHFFLARDGLARKANVPATNILAKQLIVAMAKRGTWEGILMPEKMRYKDVFEKARLDAVSELRK